VLNFLGGPWRQTQHLLWVDSPKAGMVQVWPAMMATSPCLAEPSANGLPRINAGSLVSVVLTSAQSHQVEAEHRVATANTSGSLDLR
jgi:hypothetical protein